MTSARQQHFLVTVCAPQGNITALKLLRSLMAMFDVNSAAGTTNA